MPVDWVPRPQRPSIAAWQRHYEAKGCGYWKALKLASKRVNAGRHCPGAGR